MISNVVLSTTPEFRSPFSDRFTVTLTHYGQFIDHDIIFTPDATRADPYSKCMFITTGLYCSFLLSSVKESRN